MLGLKSSISQIKQNKPLNSKKIKKQKIEEYYLEDQALRNGFGKMVNSNYKTNPTYSFPKAKKCFSFNNNPNNPGPARYEPNKYFFISICETRPKYSFPKQPKHSFRSNWYIKYSKFYDIPGSFDKPNNGYKFGHGKRFKDDEKNENLFLPTNYS